MDSNTFLKDLKPIFDKEDIVWFDEILFHKIFTAKRNTAGTKVKKKDGREYFFKVLKPWAVTWSFLEYQKGVFVYELLAQAKISAFPHVYTKGHDRGLYYFIEQIIPIEDTLGDKEIMTLTENDGKRLRSKYEETKKQADTYLQSHPEIVNDAVALMPNSILSHSNYSQNASFWGQMILFERQLIESGHLKHRAIGDKVVGYLNECKKDLYASSAMYILHGDFASHNVVYGKEIYFVDWERAILTQIPYVGHYYDLSNMYVYSFGNPAFQKAFWIDTEGFKLCMAYHLLYKASYVLGFDKRDEKGLFDWCMAKLNEIEF